jgi:hypothetical protein
MRFVHGFDDPFVYHRHSSPCAGVFPRIRFPPFGLPLDVQPALEEIEV